MTVRPFVKEFLENLSEHYDIVVYTASDREYAHAVVKLIDPERVVVKEILHRRHCIKTEKGYTVKDLRLVVGTEDVSKVVLVDNSTHCFAP